MELSETEYLGRPVWPFSPQWGRLEDSWEANVESATVGFGAPTRWRRADEARRLFKVQVALGSRAALTAMEDFFAAVGGRRRMFWYPSLASQYRLVADVSAGDTVLEVAEVGGSSAWGSRTGLAHVAFFTRSGLVCAELSGVTPVDAQTERLTLAAPLAQDVTAAQTVVSPLLAVRFGADELDFEHVTDAAARVSVSLVELPKEYLAESAGLMPVYLYRIEWGNVVHRFTSHAVELEIGGQVWTPQDISHGGFSRTINFLDEGGSLSWNHADPAFWLREYRGRAVDPWQVSITEASLPAASLPEPFYVGYFAGVSSSAAATYQVTLTSHAGLDQRTAPGIVYARKCSWIQYGSACGLQSLFWTKNGTVSAVNMAWGNAWLEIPEVAVEAQSLVDAGRIATVNDYLPGGEVVADGKRFTVIAQEGARLYVLWPRPGVAVGAGANWRPACQQDLSRCAGLFSNGINFGGDPYAPILNPHGRAWQIEQVTSGGKK